MTAGRRAVKWKVLPDLPSLSTQISPPIISTSCAEMARPRPVPPNSRRDERVDLRERLEDAALLIGGDADAGVA